MSRTINLVIFGFGLLAVTLHYGSGVEQFGKCKTPKPVTVDEKFLKHSKFYIPFHSDCENCEKGGVWSSFMGRSIGSKKICYILSGTRLDGSTFDAVFRCIYMTPGIGSCELLRKEPPYLSGNMILTKTDNQTYMAGATCIFGKENYWWVASVNETIPDKLKEEIMDDFEEKGFKTDNLVDPETSEIVFRQFTISNKTC